MLEMFFDNEKVFSVFRQMLQEAFDNKSMVCMPRILYDLNVPVEDAATILNSFEFLGIISETEDTQENGVFKFEPKSSVALALCSFDEVVEKFAVKKIKEGLLSDRDDEKVDKIILDALFDGCENHICSYKDRK